MNDQILNIIKAGAIGDAFGYQVEFDDWERLKDKYGASGIEYKESVLEKDASDDTQMTLFLWEAVNTYYAHNKDYTVKSFTAQAHKSFLEWFNTQKSSSMSALSGLLSADNLLSKKEMFKRQAPGSTCLSALSSTLSRDIYRKINDSKGCGSVMRVAPLLILKELYHLDSEQLLTVSMHQAAITHGNDEGMAATGFFTVLLEELRSNDIHTAYQTALALTEKLKPTRFTAYIQDVYLKAQEESLFENDELELKIGSGWTADEAVGVALYCMIKSQTFKQCLELSTNHGGDSDSTASMAAQLYVAKHGLLQEDILFETDLDIVILHLKDKLNNRDVKMPFRRI